MTYISLLSNNNVHLSINNEQVLLGNELSPLANRLGPEDHSKPEGVVARAFGKVFFPDEKHGVTYIVTPAEAFLAFLQGRTDFAAPDRAWTDSNGHYIIESLMYPSK